MKALNPSQETCLLPADTWAMVKFMVNLLLTQVLWTGKSEWTVDFFILPFGILVTEGRWDIWVIGDVMWR